jgi:Questin oxidase-like
MSAPAYAPLDDALETLSHYGPDLTNGNFNHAPMVCEALCALGRPEAVFPWIEAYRARLTPRAVPGGEPVDWSQWRTHLGKREMFDDWSRFFASELGEAPWRSVLDRWAARLAPGYSGAAVHGAIRTAHAARGLAEAETRVRLRELADALASWAASYSELPAATFAGPKLAPEAALAAVLLVPCERRPPGNITTALSKLVEFPEFAPVIDTVDLGEDLDAAVAVLGELFVRTYLANAVDTRNFIVFVHAVTAVHALGNLLPHVGAASGRLLARYAWQAGCGLYAAFGVAPPIDGTDAPDEALQALVAEAIANGDEHVIKFTEAALARHKIAPSPIYPMAIRHALGVVRRR